MTNDYYLDVDVPHKKIITAP